MPYVARHASVVWTLRGSCQGRWPVWLILIRTDIEVYLRSTPHPVTVTTRIITFLVGNPYKPSFATVTGWGVDLRYTLGID